MVDVPMGKTETMSFKISVKMKFHYIQMLKPKSSQFEIEIGYNITLTVWLICIFV